MRHRPALGKFRAEISRFRHSWRRSFGESLRTPTVEPAVPPPYKRSPPKRYYWGGEFRHRPRPGKVTRCDKSIFPRLVSVVWGKFLASDGSTSRAPALKTFESPTVVLAAEIPPSPRPGKVPRGAKSLFAIGIGRLAKGFSPPTVAQEAFHP